MDEKNVEHAVASEAGVEKTVPAAHERAVAAPAVETRVERPVAEKGGVCTFGGGAFVGEANEEEEVGGGADMHRPWGDGSGIVVYRVMYRSKMGEYVREEGRLLDYSRKAAALNANEDVFEWTLHVSPDDFAYAADCVRSLEIGPVGGYDPLVDGLVRCGVLS